MSEEGTEEVAVVRPPHLFGPGPSPGVNYPLVVNYCGGRLYEGVKKQTDGDDDKKHQKRGGKGNKPTDKKKAPAGPSKITLQREPRGKKSVTVVRGLAANGTLNWIPQISGIDLKQASKLFSSKFACGSSVTATDEIVIQGDVKDNLIDFIAEKWAQVEPDLIEDLGDKKR